MLRVRLERSAIPGASMESVLEGILTQMNVGAIAVRSVPYENFDCDVDLRYESKWKHARQ